MRHKGKKEANRLGSALRKNLQARLTTEPDLESANRAPQNKLAK